MEKLEDLQVGGLYIYQSTDLYRFTSDAVLLSDFVHINKSDYVVDFGTGSGVIPLLIFGKYPVKKITGIEIQKALASMANRSIEYNGLEDVIDIKNVKIQNAHRHLEKHPDVIVCNPPYRKVTDNIISKNDSEKIAKFEVELTLPELMDSVRRNLKFGGRFYMIHAADRLAEIVKEMNKNDISIKTIRFVHAKKNSLAHLVLIEGRSGSKAQTKIMPPLILKNEDGTDSDEVLRIYNRTKKEK